MSFNNNNDNNKLNIGKSDLTPFPSLSSNYGNRNNINDGGMLVGPKQSIFT